MVGGAGCLCDPDSEVAAPRPEKVSSATVSASYALTSM